LWIEGRLGQSGGVSSVEHGGAADLQRRDEFIVDAVIATRWFSDPHMMPLSNDLLSTMIVAAA